MHGSVCLQSIRGLGHVFVVARFQEIFCIVPADRALRC